jgi:uncharacterized protein YcfJ
MPIRARSKRVARAFSLAALLLIGCASIERRPILYPNAHYTSVGRSVADRDIASCMEAARVFGADGDRGADVARDTMTGALVGAAAGGAWGAVRGDAAERALAGAAAGGAGGLTRGVVKASEPSSTYRQFVQRCLRDRGYEVIGWR